MTPHFLRECVRAPEAAWALENTTTASLLASSLLPAFDRETRNQGLLGRSGLAPQQALVLAPCSGVHTWFMRFPIDVLFVSRDGTVLKVRRAVQPWRLTLRFGAFAVVEMAAGASSGTEVGHRIALIPSQAGS